MGNRQCKHQSSSAGPSVMPTPKTRGIGLDKHSERVREDLQLLAYPKREWVKPITGPKGEHCYDVVVIGGGQCGLATAFGLKRESVDNVLVLDENPEGKEGPWVTYARMVTLRTNKCLTGPDLGVPSLTFQCYYEAKYGKQAWEALDKIPKEEWMSYLVWYRQVLAIKCENDTKVQLIEPQSAEDRGYIYRMTVTTKGKPRYVWARKVVLATGIQGGGEWHVPEFIKAALPASKYAHTSQMIDFEKLKGKRVAILGGGASAFDNAQWGLERGVGEVHVFVRREEMPRINPIRHMEYSGFLRHFSDLDDATKYAGINFFLQFNQPPTNCTYNRACKFPNFFLHTGSGWDKLAMEGDQVRVTSAKGDEGLFDMLIVSTGLLTDTKLRPELAAMAGEMANWADRYQPASEAERNKLIDVHPYLGNNFEFTEKIPGAAPYVRGIFAYNYSALASLGLSGSAISGMKYAMPKLLYGITKQLFLDDQHLFVGDLLSYRTNEFLGEWPPASAKQ